MSAFFNGDTTANRCLGIIERNAARFLKAGGGALGKECAPREHKGNAFTRTLTDDDKARMIELRRGGRRQHEIAAELRWSQTTVGRVLRDAGFTIPLPKRKHGMGAKREIAA